MTDNKQYPDLPIVGYLRATKSGEPIWSEDCVCEDPVYPSDPEGSDSDCISMPVVRLSDAVRAMRAQAAPPILSSVRLHNAWANGFRAALAWRQSVDEFWKDNEFGKAPREPENPYKVSVSGVHDLFETKDKDAPDAIRDGNGEVVLALCKRCNKAESQLWDDEGLVVPCVAAKGSDAQAAQVVPAGWKLVPVEPTEAMLDAAPSNPVVPAAVPTSLPEPDFTLDGGNVGCYYESTVRRLIAAELAGGVNHSERALGMVAGAPAQGDAEDDEDQRELESIGRAVNRAATDLPLGARLRIDLERDAGSVCWLDRGKGAWRTIEGAGEFFSNQIHAAIDAAMAQGKEGSR